MQGVRAVDGQTLEMDIANFDGVGPTIYNLDTADEEDAEIMQWWTNFKSKTTKYHLMNCNCSTVVSKALSVVYGNVEDWYVIKEVWTPNDVERVVQRLITGEYKKMHLSRDMETINIMQKSEFVVIQRREETKSKRNRRTWWTQISKRGRTLVGLDDDADAATCCFSCCR